LAVHLGLAFVILALMAWYVLRLGRQEAELMTARRDGDRGLSGLATGLVYLTFLQILIGALVAGIDAGRNYVDWPLMAGAFTPPNMWAIEPWYRNLFENDGTVQFFHRITGYVLLLFGIGAWIVSRRSSRAATKRAFDWVGVMMFGQIVLGIVTVMHSSPWYLAILHQFGAVVLITLILRARFLARYPLPQSVRGAA
jgi:cytochrome c oxidase assembly protein subunit 15